MDIAAATEVIAGLRAKRAGVLARRDEITDEMSALGFAAHAEGDAGAKKKLAALTSELAALAASETSLTGALSEAERRLAAARAEAAAQAEAERVEACDKLADEIRGFGVQADAVLSQLVAVIAQRRDRQDKLRRIGGARSYGLSAVSDARAVATALSGLGRGFDSVAPSLRLTFAQLDARSLGVSAPAADAEAAA